MSTQGGADNKAGGRIVVGVDGSQSSKDALAWALRQGERTGASVLVVLAWEMPTSFGWPAPLPESYDPETDANTALDAIIGECVTKDSGVKVDRLVAQGHPAPVILEAARDAELIVVGSRGHGAFTGMLLGSVSEYVSSHARCPVVIVRHHSGT